MNEFIEEVCQNVEDSYQLFHQLCLDSQELLQPWPSVDDTNNDKNRKDSNSKEDVSSSERANNEEHDLLLSTEEAKALEEVEDILNKAQEARQQHSKVGISIIGSICNCQN